MVLTISERRRVLGGRVYTMFLVELSNSFVDTAFADLPKLKARTKGTQKRTRDIANSGEIALSDEDRKNQ